MPGSGTPPREMHIPLLGGVQEWVFPNQKDPPRNADAFCPSQGGFSDEFQAGENFALMPSLVLGLSSRPLRLAVNLARA